MSLIAASRSESTKLFTTSMWWLLALILFVYVAFTAGALALVFSLSSTGGLEGGAPAIPAEVIPPAIYSITTSVGYVFPLLIGTLIVTGELRHQTLTPTFLATPRRGIVLGAKLLIGVEIGVLYAVIGIVAALVPGAIILASADVDTALGTADTWAMLGRILLAYILWTFIGIGVGALVRNQVGAIVGVLVFTQFVEPIARAAAMVVDGLSDFTQYLPGAASDALVGASVFAMSTPPGTESLEWWAGGLVLLGYAAVLVVLGHALSWRRDVS